jgi:hypothetical protein
MSCGSRQRLGEIRRFPKQESITQTEAGQRVNVSPKLCRCRKHHVADILQLNAGLRENAHILGLSATVAILSLSAGLRRGIENLSRKLFWAGLLFPELSGEHLHAVGGHYNRRLAHAQTFARFKMF